MIEDIDGYEQLKEIGSQKLHEDTHIPKVYTKGLVDESFEKMNKIQFIGFISILEREYSINLNTLKEKGLDYFEDNTKEFTIAKKVFINEANKKTSYVKLYIVAAIILFIIFMLSNSTPSLETQDVDLKLDNANIHNATQSIAPKIEQVMLDEEAKREKDRLAATFKILPKTILWVGYINQDTGEKLQETFNDELALNPHGHWLLTLGHGNVDFEINGKLQQYQTSRNIRFEFKDGKLRKISTPEFTRLNKGEKW